jgi:hypothetical protein
MLVKDQPIRTGRAALCAERPRNGAVNAYQRGMARLLVVHRTVEYGLAR